MLNTFNTIPKQKHITVFKLDKLLWQFGNDKFYTFSSWSCSVDPGQ